MIILEIEGAEKARLVIFSFDDSLDSDSNTKARTIKAFDTLLKFYF